MSVTETILFSRKAIAQRVEELAEEIASAPCNPEVAVPILAGAFVFAADLLRALAAKHIALPIEFVWLRSYDEAQTPQNVEILRGPDKAVSDKSVLVIDGVLDSGATLAAARELLFAAGVRSINSVVAVAKNNPLRIIEADYVGFNSGPEFIYGYGMDYAGSGRGLAEIRIAPRER
nr:MAG: hypoxanthine phosphoribosyltransferase [Hyphomicrobiales bacterium]